MARKSSLRQCQTTFIGSLALSALPRPDHNDTSRHPNRANNESSGRQPHVESFHARLENMAYDSISHDVGIMADGPQLLATSPVVPDENFVSPSELMLYREHTYRSQVDMIGNSHASLPETETKLLPARPSPTPAPQSSRR